MYVNPAARRWLGLVFAVTGAAAQAGTVSLGEVAAPLSWHVDRYAPAGALQDRFTFSIAGDAPWIFSSFVTTGFYKYSKIPTLMGELFRDGELLASGDARGVPLEDFRGIPAHDVTFNPLVLGRGDYELRFSGTVYSAFLNSPIGSHYTGQIEFQEAAAVPEPSSMSLAGLGLMALLASAFSRSRKTI